MNKLSHLKKRFVDNVLHLKRNKLVTNRNKQQTKRLHPKIKFHQFRNNLNLKKRNNLLKKVQKNKNLMKNI